jgi:hypothetical protein
MRIVLGLALVLSLAAAGAEAREPAGPAAGTLKTAAQVPVKPRPALKPQASSGLEFDILARAGVFLASDREFKPIYGTGPVFGLEMRLRARRASAFRLDGFLEGNYRERKGSFSFTKDSTRVKVTAVEGGVLYRVLRGPISPYLGGGAGFYMFAEQNAIRGKASQNKAGYVGAAGVSGTIRGHFVFDVRAKYSGCRIKPAEYAVNIGGLTLGGGLGIRF